ncbi:pyruvate, water dikinase regulatory protein [Mangrovibacterium lignilyticum]|uniref:pyruvate, water dikinase regulatory protein n=1 Tax=Mangrovibacterium lignilyticum TaxID=2668052 RepID=UPI0013D05E25|nr:pyruvate, water dikinase regulatory protein [Mangrovibacterium lignilyticum]
MTTKDNSNRPSPIYVVSGGKGLAGNNMVQSMLIQYPNNNVAVILVPHVVDESQILDTVLKAKEDGGLITHTMVQHSMRRRLIELAAEHGVPQIDFMGPLAEYLDEKLEIPSLQMPGLFREIKQQYFERIDAIEFTLDHDDGLSPQRLSEAEIVLCGLSRSGKTPLSVYLALYGWKVANVPLVPGIQPPEELFQIDPGRVFGLQISKGQLLSHRVKRLRNFKNTENTSYVDEQKINEEIRFANLVFLKGRFTVIPVTNKPVESSANEIISYMSSRYDFGGRKIHSPFMGNGSDKE